MRVRKVTVAIAVVLIAGCTAAGGAATNGPSTTPVPPATPAPTVSKAPVATPSPATTAPPATTGPATPAPSFLYDPTADARADIAAALTAAKADGKRVLLDFGADWCPDCHVLAAYLEGAAGRALVEPAFHVVRIDVGFFDHNLDVVRDYLDMRGIPEVVVLDAKGAIVGSSAVSGSLASASGMTEKQVLDEIRAWAE
jgi:thiol-disulfide isomerase/thioredoxin